MPRKLILSNFQSPGDIVMLTAAVRDLNVSCPGAFITDVRTSCPDLWLHNPWLTPLADHDPEAELLSCHYPLIHQSNQLPYHFIHGFIQFLGEHLGVRMQPTQFKGDIHLSAEEKAIPVPGSAEIEGRPFWLIAAGGKFDFTIKWWETARYQEVVDHFAGKLLFVQVGENGHH